jgi:hypothetical protein
VAQEVLVSVEHPEDVAAVIREEDGSLWLTGYLSHGPGTLIEAYVPASEGLEGGLRVEAGRMPPGAVRAIGVDLDGSEFDPAVANGVWLMVLPRRLFASKTPVRFEDAQGSIVAPPLPEAWSRNPVTDAKEPCPACGESTWEQVTPDDDSRGMRGDSDGEMEPSPIAVCHTCGYEVEIGVWFAVEDGDDEPPEQRLAREAAFEQEMRVRKAQALQSIDFPVLSPQGGEPVLDGWGGWGTTSKTTVRIGAKPGCAGSRVVVETEKGFDDLDLLEELALQSFEDLLSEEDGVWPTRSDAGMAIWMRTRKHAHERRAADAPKRQLQLDCQDEAVPFQSVGDEKLWAAAGRCRDLQIRISSRGVPPDDISLVEIDDLLEFVR